MAKMEARGLGLFLAVALMSLLAGCGGGDDAGEEVRTMRVEGTEMAFEAPNSVPAGTYEVTFENIGAVAHELAFRSPDGEFVARRSIAAGEEVVMEVELTPGTWELGCFEPGHYEAGMQRPLLVTDS